MRFIKKIKRAIVKQSDAAEDKEKAGKFADKAWREISRGMGKIGNEARETKEMSQLFFRLLEEKLRLNTRKDAPTEEEVRAAIEQLKDVGRLSIFTTAVILPGGAVSLIGLELLARKAGIKRFTFIPSSFRKNAEWKYPKGYTSVSGKRSKKQKRNITDVKPIEGE